MPVHTIYVCVYLYIYTHERKAQKLLCFSTTGSSKWKGKAWQTGNWNFLKY